MKYSHEKVRSGQAGKEQGRQETTPQQIRDGRPEDGSPRSRERSDPETEQGQTQTQTQSKPPRDQGKTCKTSRALTGPDLTRISPRPATAQTATTRTKHTARQRQSKIRSKHRPEDGKAGKAKQDQGKAHIMHRYTKIKAGA